MLEAAKTSDQPVLIACKTTIGFGAPTKAGTAGSHGAALGAEEIEGARAALNWPHPPFHIPDDILAEWRAAGARGAEAHAAWTARLEASGQGEAFTKALTPEPPAEALDALANHVRLVAAGKPVKATRASSGDVIDAIADVYPGLIGGSADLTGSNNTRAKSHMTVTARDFSGAYIHYGVREHAMAAAMNGMSLHGGVRPYGGTFLIFSDYCRPSIRLSALMNQPVIYVFTHDSIGLGEDGPTHQPVEHLAALRAMPNLEVYRPCDALEAAEAWACALERTDGPTVLALSRQKTPHLREDDGLENLSAWGAYTLRAEDDPQVVLIGTGTETALAVEAHETLKTQGVRSRVVSAPCLDRFLGQPRAVREQVLPTGVPVVAVEAGMRWGWDALIGAEGGFVGMTGFGGSAPAEALYAHFKITTDAVVAEALKRI